MEKNELKNKIRNIVHQVYKNPEEKIQDPFEQYGDFSKFPELKSVIYTLLTVDFPVFVSSIDWVAPKPTTFCITLSNSEYFFLIFNERGWTAMIEGKKYKLMNFDEEYQASEAISRLLYYSNSLNDNDYEEDDSDWNKESTGKRGRPSGDSSSSSSSSSGGGSSDSDSDSTDNTLDEPTTDTSDSENLNEIYSRLDASFLFEGAFEKLNDNAKKWAEELSKELGYPIEKFESHSRNRIILYVDKPRNQIFKKLIELGYEKKDITGSSQGGVVNEDGVELILKPDGKKGELGDGKENEHSFNEIINNAIRENNGPITVVFQSDKKTIKVTQVKEAIDSSKSGASKFDKSDTKLKTSGEDFNISLKQRNAIRWESSKTRKIDGVNIFDSFISKVGILNKKEGFWKNVCLSPYSDKKNKYRLYDPINNKVLSKVIITNTPSEVISEVIFGNESPKPIVIKEDFIGYNNYSFENGVLTMKCHIIYNDIKDILNTYDEPVFAFSNHINQAYGIEFRSFSKGLLMDGDKLKGASTSIDFNDLK